MPLVYLGLGGNRGDAAATLRAAFAELSLLLKEARLSSLWISRARYYEAQPDFVNAVCGGETTLSPTELLGELHRIEARFGRNRVEEIRKGPRSLDLDILLYGNRLVVQENLVIPHVGLKERKFALLPLLELDPGIIDPASGRPFMEYLAALPPQGIYQLDAGRYDLVGA